MNTTPTRAEQQRQTFAVATRAEIRRLLGRSGIRGGVITALISALLGSIASALILSAIGPEALGTLPTLALEISAVLTAIVLGMSSVVSAGRNAAGTTPSPWP